MDYRLLNNAHRTCQLISYLDEEYLHGKIRTDESQTYKVHIKTKMSSLAGERIVYRSGKVYTTSIKLLKLKYPRS